MAEQFCLPQLVCFPNSLDREILPFSSHVLPTTACQIEIWADETLPLCFPTTSHERCCREIVFGTLTDFSNIALNFNLTAFLIYGVILSIYCLCFHLRAIRSRLFIWHCPNVTKCFSFQFSISSFLLMSFS